MPEQLLSLRVERRLSEVGRVNDEIAFFWRMHQLPEDTRLDVLLSIEEALSNVIRHGGAGSRVARRQRQSRARSC